MLPLGSEGGFHFRIIWDDELETEMGSRGTEGSGSEKEKRAQCEEGASCRVGVRGDTQVREIMRMFTAMLFNVQKNITWNAHPVRA